MNEEQELSLKIKELEEKIEQLKKEASQLREKRAAIRLGAGGGYILWQTDPLVENKLRDK